MDAPSQDAVSHPAPDRVLVVDDERNIRSMIRVCLEQAGCEVREASSADAALAALASGPVDVAFVDLRLGTGNGLLQADPDHRADISLVVDHQHPVGSGVGHGVLRRRVHAGAFEVAP